MSIRWQVVALAVIWTLLITLIALREPAHAQEYIETQEGMIIQVRPHNPIQTEQLLLRQDGSMGRIYTQPDFGPQIIRPKDSFRPRAFGEGSGQFR